MKEIETYESNEEYKNIINNAIEPNMNYEKKNDYYRESIKNIAQDSNHMAKLLIENKLKIMEPYFNNMLNNTISEKNSIEEESSFITYDKQFIASQSNEKNNHNSDSMWKKSKYLYII